MTNTELLKEVKKGTHFVKFHANWCGPCKVATNVLGKWMPNNNVNLIEVNIDTLSELAQEYSVRNIPTLLVFKDGEIVERLVGVPTEAQLNQYS